MKFPFEASLQEIRRNPEPFVDSVFSSLQSEFMVLPKGPGFVEYPVFESAYEALKSATRGFVAIDMETVYPLVVNMPITLIVLRSMLGFTPSEWAYVTTQRTGVEVDQGVARGFDRKVRINPTVPLRLKGLSEQRLKALVEASVSLLSDGAPAVDGAMIHRLDKADTRSGKKSLRTMASMGFPYAMVLYERFLGRPFAGHRDSVSGLVGDVLEAAVEEVLAKAGVSFRKTKRAERIEGFDQAPDFIIPSEFSPQVVIEAKITEDDGTARDKVTRIQHLGELAGGGRGRKFEVVACIDGRGFGVRREDMKKLLLATGGKVFTMKTLEHLVGSTQLIKFRTG
jgi:hypothetical protein